MQVRVVLSSGNVHVLDLQPGVPLTHVEDAIVQLEHVDRRTHRVRLIASGKLLSDLNVPVDRVVSNGGFIHGAISEHPPPPPSLLPAHRRPRFSSRAFQLQRSHSAAAATSEFHASEVVIHLSTGIPADATNLPEGVAEQLENRVIAEAQRLNNRDGVVALPVLHTVDENGDVRIIIRSLTVRGFDRLREAGFSDVEISAIRRQFRIARGFPALPDHLDIQSDQAVDLEVEEAWLNSSGDDNGELEFDPLNPRNRNRHESRIVVTNSAEGSNIDFLLGCVCGYLVGILTLALLLDKNISRRWRVGIAAGIATNCAFGFLRASLYVQSSSFSSPP